MLKAFALSDCERTTLSDWQPRHRRRESRHARVSARSLSSFKPASAAADDERITSSASAVNAAAEAAVRGRALECDREFRETCALPVESADKVAKHWVVHRWAHLKETMRGYWVGTTLLWVEIKISRVIVSRVLRGSSLTMCERAQLVRTTADVFRAVPFALFLAVPFSGPLLPVALWLFPGMLPSTFQDATKKEASGAAHAREKAKVISRARLSMKDFVGETLETMKKVKSKRAEERASTSGLSLALQKAKCGPKQTPASR